MISEDTTAAIYSPESADGSWLSLSPDGPKTGPSGQARARASRSASPARAKGKRTPDTCGPLFTGSSLSVDLQWCLASRLQARLDTNGSPEYALTWSELDMPWGPPICRLRAQSRSIRGSDSFGLPMPTPSATDHKGGHSQPDRRRMNGHMNLRDWFRGRYNLHYPPVRVVRWLMSFPAAWDDCAPTATPSSRKSRPSS